MANPVVHFEIIGPDPAKLRSYYGDLFGWQFDTSSPVAEPVSEAGNYGFVDQISAPDGTGIRGGVGGGKGYAKKVIFYVGVPSVAEAVKKAESLGGKCVMGPAKNPDNDLVVAHVEDPEGNVVGLAGGR